MEVTLELSCCKYPPASDLQVSFKFIDPASTKQYKLFHSYFRYHISSQYGFFVFDINHLCSGILGR